MAKPRLTSGPTLARDFRECWGSLYFKPHLCVTRTHSPAVPTAALPRQGEAVFGSCLADLPRRDSSPASGTSAGKG